MSKEIKIGIIGAGNNTRSKHIPKLQKIDGVSIETVCNRSKESSRAVAESFNIPRISDDWQELIRDSSLDAIVIGTWPYLHAPATVAALQAGKHVLCEARMAMNVHEARQMLKTSMDDPSLVAQVVPSPFTLHWDRFIKRKLDENLIGELFAVDVFANSGSFIDTEQTMTWRDDIEKSGLNTMMLGIYYEALSRWVGHAATVKTNGRIQVKNRGGHPIHIPDHLDVFGDLENGAAYHIRCSQITGACPTPNGFILYGSRGTLRLQVQKEVLTLDKPGEETQIMEVPESEQESWRVEEEFVGAIRGEEKIRLTSFEEGLQYMKFTQKVADDLKLAPSEFRNP